MRPVPYRNRLGFLASLAAMPTLAALTTLVALATPAALSALGRSVTEKFSRGLLD